MNTKGWKSSKIFEYSFFLPVSVEEPVDLGQESEEVRAAVDVYGLPADGALLVVLRPLDFVEELVPDDGVEKVLQAESHLLRRRYLIHILKVTMSLYRVSHQV